MILSIEETDTGYRLDFPDGGHDLVEGDDNTEQAIGAALLRALGRDMPAKLTLPATAVGQRTEGEDGEKVPRLDLKGARSLSELEDRVGEFLHDNAVTLGRKGLNSLQKVCADTNFRGKRYAS